MPGNLALMQGYFSLLRNIKVCQWMRITSDIQETIGLMNTWWPKDFFPVMPLAQAVPNKLTEWSWTISLNPHVTVCLCLWECQASVGLWWEAAAWSSVEQYTYVQCTRVRNITFCGVQCTDPRDRLYKCDMRIAHKWAVAWLRKFWWGFTLKDDTSGIWLFYFLFLTQCSFSREKK